MSDKSSTCRVRFTDLEPDICDTTRRLKGIGELLQAWSSDRGLSAENFAILQTLCNDAEAGAVQVEALFYKAHKEARANG